MQTSTARSFARAHATFILMVSTLALSFAGYLLKAQPARATPRSNKPTVVLIHGAFAESAGWNGVAGRLLGKGYPVVAAANPLRGVKSDAAYVGKLLDSIKGPIVLVGHSYGGSVISGAAL